MRRPTRRRLLKVAPLLAVGVAGCGGDDAGDGTQTTRVTDTPTADPTTEPTTSERQTTTEEGPASRTAILGEAIAGDQMSMVAKSVSRTQTLGDLQEADPGNTFALVRLEVKNTTQDTYADFSSFLQTQLKDDGGYTYSPVLSVSETAFQGGQLAPGEVTRGDVAFEVPEDASGLTLQFDFSAFSFTDFDRVTVDLSTAASSTADLEQTLHVPVQGIGDTVTHEGSSVTLNGVEFRRSVNDFAEAGEGMEFAIVDVTTANESDEVTTFSSLLQMEVKDGTGLPYSFSLTATSQLTRGYDGGEVAPGEQVRGKLAFEVSQDSSELYFTFEYATLEGGSRTFWQLR